MDTFYLRDRQRDRGGEKKREGGYCTFCVCVCVYSYIPVCGCGHTYHRVPVELRGQPLVLALAFHKGPVVHRYVCQAS